MSKGGRYVHRPGHPKANDVGMVNVLDLGDDDSPQEEGRSGGNFIIDRWLEGTASPVDGSDIGSRRKRAEHMKIHGLVDADDYKGQWAKDKAERERFRRTGDDGKPWVQRFADTWEKLQKRSKY
jgi:hypothetical protein